MQPVTTLSTLYELLSLSKSLLSHREGLSLSAHPLSFSLLYKENLIKRDGQDGPLLLSNIPLSDDPHIPPGILRLTHHTRYIDLPIDLHLSPPNLPSALRSSYPFTFTPRGGIVGARAECLDCSWTWTPEEGTTLSDCAPALHHMAQLHRQTSGGHSVHFGVRCTLAGKVVEEWEKRKGGLYSEEFGWDERAWEGCEV